MPEAIVLNREALWLIGGFASVAMVMFSYVMTSFTLQVKSFKEEISAKVNNSDIRSSEIEINYNIKFDKTHEKLDKLNAKIDIVVEKVAEQTGFYKAIQVNKSLSKNHLAKHN